MKGRTLLALVLIVGAVAAIVVKERRRPATQAGSARAVRVAPANPKAPEPLVIQPARNLANQIRRRLGSTEPPTVEWVQELVGRIVEPFDAAQKQDQRECLGKSPFRNFGAFRPKKPGAGRSLALAFASEKLCGKKTDSCSAVAAASARGPGCWQSDYKQVQSPHACACSDAVLYRCVHSIGAGSMDTTACSAYLGWLSADAELSDAKNPNVLKRRAAMFRDLLVSGNDALCREIGGAGENSICKALSRVQTKGDSACARIEKRDRGSCTRISRIFNAAKSGSTTRCGKDRLCRAAFGQGSVCSSGALEERRTAALGRYCAESAGPVDFANSRAREEFYIAQSSALDQLDYLRFVMRKKIDHVDSDEMKKSLEVSAKAVDRAYRSIASRRAQ